MILNTMFQLSSVSAKNVRLFMTKDKQNLRKCWRMMRSFPEKSISPQSAFRLAGSFPVGAANDTEFNTASTFNKLRLRPSTCVLYTSRRVTLNSNSS